MDTPNKKKGRNKGWDNLIPIKPGEVRNPKGRPKKGDAWADIYNNILDSDEINLIIKRGDEKEEIKIETEQRSMRYALGIALLQAGLDGNVNAIKELSDRTIGKAPQTVKVKEEIDDLEKQLQRACDLMDAIDEANGTNRPNTDTT